MDCCSRSLGPGGGSSIFEARTHASADYKKYPYPLVAQPTDVVELNSVMKVEEVDKPLIGVQAPEKFDGGVNCGVQA